MSHQNDARVLEAFRQAGATDSFALTLLQALASAGLQVADSAREELVTRWVNVEERAVPPEADTIIRTITRTTDTRAISTTHWLDGLRSPKGP